MKCQVQCCRYVAEADLDGFQVCPLHDAPQVQRLLDRGEQPHAYWSCGRPIVLPSGPLAPVVVEGTFGAAFDDPRLSDVDDRVTCLVGEWADLTRGR